MRDMLKQIDVKHVIKPGSKIKLEKGKAKIRISGTVPEGVQSGDKILVHVTAKYPGTRESVARSVEFIQTLHIQEAKSVN